MFVATATRLLPTAAAAAAADAYDGGGVDAGTLHCAAGDTATAVADAFAAARAEGSSVQAAFAAATADLYEERKPRLVFDGRRQSALAPAIPFALPAGDQLMQRVTRAGQVGTFDLAGGFYHVVMAREASPWLAFKHRGTTYSYLRLPMGISIARRCSASCPRR